MDANARAWVQQLSPRILSGLDSISAPIAEAIQGIRAAEGGYSERDMDDLPCLEGVTSRTWQWYVNSHPEFHVHLATKEQAANDLRAIAGHGGKAYTHVPRAMFSEIMPDIAYEKYLVAPGFTQLNSIETQKYLIELSYRRGEDSARWALAYASGVEPRHAEPLMVNNEGFRIMKRGEARDHAIEYANGWMNSGASWQYGHQGDKPNPDFERRFYARLRLASVLEESHMVGRGFDKIALGLFSRAFDFKWMPGTSRENPGFDPQSSDDQYFANLYDNYKQYYDTYKAELGSHKKGVAATAHDRFNQNILNLANTELCDPSSPMNAHGTPTVCRIDREHFAQLDETQRLMEHSNDKSGSLVYKGDWPLNNQQGPAMAHSLNPTEARGRLEDIFERYGWDYGAFTRYYKENPTGAFPYLNKNSNWTSVQYIRGLDGKESIAIQLDSHGTVSYDVDRQGHFLGFTRLPANMPPVRYTEAGVPMLPYTEGDPKSPASKVHYFPLDVAINQRIMFTGRQNDLHLGALGRGLEKTDAAMDKLMTGAVNIVGQVLNDNVRNPTAHAWNDALQHAADWIHGRKFTPVAFKPHSYTPYEPPKPLHFQEIAQHRGTDFSGGLLHNVWNDTQESWSGKQLTRELDAKNSFNLAENAALSYERGVLYDPSRGQYVGVPQGAILPRMQSMEGAHQVPEPKHNPLTDTGVKPDTAQAGPSSPEAAQSQLIARADKPRSSSPQQEEKEEIQRFRAWVRDQYAHYPDRDFPKDTHAWLKKHGGDITAPPHTSHREPLPPAPAIRVAIAEPLPTPRAPAPVAVKTVHAQTPAPRTAGKNSSGDPMFVVEDEHGNIKHYASLDAAIEAIPKRTDVHHTGHGDTNADNRAQLDALMGIVTQGDAKKKDRSGGPGGAH